MTRNTSSECLVSDPFSEDCDFTDKNQVELEKQAEDEMEEAIDQGTGNKHLILMFVINILFWMIFLLTAAFTVYTHQQLEERLHSLENQPPYQQIGSVIDGSGSEAKFKNKFKRSDHDSTYESEHKRRTHHGIPSEHIAMMYGDPLAIPRTDDNSLGSSSNLLFQTYNQTKYKSLICSNEKQLMKNSKGYYWCRSKTDTITNSMLLTGMDRRYYYFEKAWWMNESSKYYEIDRNSTIAVKTTGIYIVHTSISFEKMYKGDPSHYGVYKVDSKGNNKQVIGKCLANSAEKKDPSEGKYLCQAWQIVALTKDDRVFMSISGYCWFEIQKETLHLVLIKLNDYGEA
ncbi:uncharacterized protein [Watersipora subatra]|uniref:uncharacterized protein isoform X2 n=1 Tax=Watersipora subatra TaxID=2589382 RepID=UPI00355B5C7C